LLGKIVPDKAEHAAKGYSLGKCDNDGWCDFASNLLAAQLLALRYGKAMLC
jgi:hypothetical protein